LLTYLIKQSRGLLILATPMGLDSVLLIAQINAALNSPAGTAISKLAGAFAVVAMASMLASVTSSILFQHLNHWSNIRDSSTRAPRAHASATVWKRPQTRPPKREPRAAMGSVWRYCGS